MNREKIQYGTGDWKKLTSHKKAWVVNDDRKYNCLMSRQLYHYHVVNGGAAALMRDSEVDGEENGHTRLLGTDDKL